MRYSVVLGLFACLLSAPAHSARSDFVTDAPSTLHYLRTDKNEITYFSGKISISGSFRIFWEREDEGEMYLQVAFMPDDLSRARLPYEGNRGPISKLWIWNTARALTLLLPADKVKLVQARKLMRAEGSAKITVTDYRTGVDCNQRGYNARILSATPGTRLSYDNILTDATGC